MLSGCTVCYLVLAVGAYLAYKSIKAILMKRKLDRWSNTPKDVVILHGISRGKTIPNPSPFVLKLESYFRMANIKYEFDDKDAFGPKGKTPWITLNGEHVSDSQLIIEFLEKKFEVNLNKSYNDQQLALATLARVTVEEHLFWGFALYAFVFDKTRKASDIINVSPAPKWLIPIFIGRNIKKLSWAHGLGRHSPEDVHKLTAPDLRSISKLLGKNKFLLGDEPCTDDAAIFGFMAQTQWGLVRDSPYQKLIDDELPNLKEYCIRMREKYWPDWDSKCNPL